MTNSHTYRNNPDSADEPLDPVEGSDSEFPQTVGEELRQVTTNTEGTINGHNLSPEDEVVELEDIVPEPPQQPSPLDQLKALAARGQEMRKADNAAKLTKPGDALSALLGRVRTRIAEDEQLKAERRRAAASDYSGMSAREREALRAKILKWETAKEWSPIACVLVIEDQTCSGCNLTHQRVYGIFQRQSRNLTAAEAREGKLPAERLVAWSPQDPNDETLKNLPRQVTHRPSEVKVCTNCYGSDYVPVTFDWERLDAQRSVMVNCSDPPRLTIKALPHDSLETIPHGKPIVAPPKGTLTPEEAAEFDALHALMFEDYGKKPLTLEQRKRLNQLAEKLNLGRNDLPEAGNT